MAEIHEWENGARGKDVKAIIDSNFKNLNNQLNQLSNRYVRTFTSSDWKNGVISINYSEYLKQNPCVDLYIKSGAGYAFVYGGYEIKGDVVELQSDIAYDGKVVIR